MHPNTPPPARGNLYSGTHPKKIRQFSSTTPAQWSDNQKFKEEEMRNVGESLKQV